ncbi:hypothetical protein GLOTRDRAFT_35883 [Gloeophyllum trabeum ATCC 11539]|uniref:Zn(2)-C6 fungal-type domain-containing protein n=1 Tax=Gloeophyllum trabeum (strain ATCC 11539 / FP-39264 / Madison 617) TaxID=670483 RepID=S7RUF8_GLOTA|nr:uncharacterized protein GLOTRDRAFT_35883 [Gloeophyllum trabeum ATCC 11539]EPQ58370.1 hypothetical protein GLOTRDRAFT_35883 [Gloeophyllum trabeum ATCC 11539]
MAARPHNSPNGVSATSGPSSPSSAVSFAFSSFHDPRRQQHYDSDGQSADEDEYSYTRSKGNVRPCVNIFIFFSRIFDCGIYSTGACVHCKSLKVRCQFDRGQSSCQRCIAGKHECVVRGRKKRKPAPSHEALLEKSHRQDATIQSILQQLDQIKAEKKVKDWIEKAQEEVASAYPRYGLSGSQSLPDVVKRGFLQMDEVHDLFKLYVALLPVRPQPFFSILDPNYHTPNYLIHTSPFLFTVVCTVASRYYDARPALYPLLMSFARDAAGRALVDASKAVETCQAYLLLAVYPKPRKRWAEDRSWTLMGVAIRLALELGINEPPPHPPTPSSLNLTRTWLNCFCVDASHATQYGKLPMVRLQDDYVARHSQDWWRCSEGNLDYDIHLCGYVDILLVMAEFRRIVDGDEDAAGQEEGDIVERLVGIDRRLAERIAHWYQLYQTQTFSTGAYPICRYRGNTTKLIAAYSRLVVLAHAFQLEFKKRGLNRGCYIVRQSVTEALLVLKIMIEDMYPVTYPTRMLRFSMEAHFLYVAYAAAFLLNLLRPKCKPLLEPNQEQIIVHEVGRLIEILGSKEVALDGRHTPMLYSRFLSSLLAKYDHSRAARNTHYAASSYSPTTGEIQPQYHQERDPTPPHMFYWPDTSQVSGMDQSAQEFPSGTVYQQSGEADMDFSMNHFLQTVVAGQQNGTYGAQFHSNSGAAEAMDERWGMPAHGGDDFFGANFTNTGWPHVAPQGQVPQYGQPWTGMRS